MATTARTIKPRTTSKATAKKTSSKRPVKRRVAALTPRNADLVRYAKSHPTPASFWSDANDASKPAKR
jgi:hypothetical protein